MGFDDVVHRSNPRTEKLPHLGLDDVGDAEKRREVLSAEREKSIGIGDEPSAELKNKTLDKLMASDNPDAAGVLQGAIEGMLDEVDDPYARYFPEAEFEEFNASLEGTFSGVGLMLAETPEGPVTVGFSEGTPAGAQPASRGVGRTPGAPARARGGRRLGHPPSPPHVLRQASAPPLRGGVLRRPGRALPAPRRALPAARWPIVLSPPAPRPRVILSPIRILWGASDWSRACASVLQAMNSTPIISARIIRLTALLPPPPTPMTRISAKFSESERSGMASPPAALEGQVRR